MEATLNKVNVKNFIKDWITPVIAAIIIAVLVNKFLLFFAAIPSTSMVPALNKGDKLVITRIYNYDNLKRGDIVVFDSEELDKLLIKRLIGLPGDHIEIEDGIVSINGKVLEEDYVKNNESLDRKLVFDVPKDKYFFLGDNRADSSDARKWKEPYIDKSNIQGKASLKFYPIKDFGTLK